MRFDELITISKAIAAERHDGPLRCCHIAFVLKRNRIVSVGVNAKKTHPLNLRYRYASYKGGTCAELSAVIRSKTEDHRNHTMVVIRVNRNGLLDYSKPCEGCQHLIAQLGFKEVWYTSKEGQFEKL